MGRGRGREREGEGRGGALASLVGVACTHIAL